jgi:type IV pilus assembly protein PilM
MFTIRNTSVGLDISDESIEVVALKKKGRGFLVTGKNRVRLPAGLVTAGVVQDTKALGKIIVTMLAEATPAPIAGKEVVFALPESQVYTHAIRLTDVKERHIAEYLPRALARVTPIPEDQLIVSWKVIRTTKEGLDVLAVAADRQVLLEWQKFLASLKLSIEAFDIESLALFRDIYVTFPKEPLCIVDIGARTLQYSFFDEHGLRYTQSGHIAGSYFTQALTTVFAEEKDAEKYKRTKGLTGKNKKAQMALRDSVDELVAHIVKTVTFFETTKEVEVGEIVYVGGSIRMPGLFSYLEKQIEKSQRIGAALRVEGTDLHEYLGAVGMALRGIEAKWKKRDVALPLVKTKKKRKASRTTAVPVESAAARSTKESPSGGRSSSVQIGILTLVIVLGAATVFWAFSYRNTEREAKEAMRAFIQEGTFAQLEQAATELDTVVDDMMSSTDMVIATSTSSTILDSVTTTDLRRKVRLQVIDTGVGFLNVRSGPGTTFEILQKLDIGDVVVQVEKEGNWVGFVLSPSTTGWATGTFLQEID